MEPQEIIAWNEDVRKLNELAEFLLEKVQARFKTAAMDNDGNYGALDNDDNYGQALDHQDSLQAIQRECRALFVATE